MVAGVRPRTRAVVCDTFADILVSAGDRLPASVRVRPVLALEDRVVEVAIGGLRVEVDVAGATGRVRRSLLSYVDLSIRAPAWAVEIIKPRPCVDRSASSADACASCNLKSGLSGRISIRKLFVQTSPLLK